MDQVTIHFYELQLQLKLLKTRGDAFQQFFGCIMNMAFPGDFMQTRPWGRDGDKKCDGYLLSKRRLFQCYAPNVLEKSQTLRKLNEDFTGALEQARGLLKEWVFVNNESDGRIPTWLVEEIAQLSTQESAVKISAMGLAEIRQVVFTLDHNNLVVLFGLAPTQKDISALGLKELHPLLEYLASQSPPSPQGVEKVLPVSVEKLAYNDLPECIAGLLKTGMQKTYEIEHFFARGSDKEKGMRIATIFRTEYANLKAQCLTATEIFDRLRMFATGPFQPGVKRDSACLTVLAWLFEECDIFEHPPVTSWSFQQRNSALKML